MKEGQVFEGHKIYDEVGQTTFTPYLLPDGQIGYIVEHDDGRVTYFYLNPSVGEGDPDHKPNIFVYQDETGGDQFVETLHYYDIWDT